MKIISNSSGSACALVVSLAIGLCGAQAQAEDLPPSLKPILGTQTASPAEVGTKNILQLEERFEGHRPPQCQDPAAAGARGHIDR